MGRRTTMGAFALLLLALSVAVFAADSDDDDTLGGPTVDGDSKDVSEELTEDTPDGGTLAEGADPDVPIDNKLAELTAAGKPGAETGDDDDEDSDKDVDGAELDKVEPASDDSDPTAMSIGLDDPAFADEDKAGAQDDVRLPDLDLDEEAAHAKSKRAKRHHSRARHHHKSHKAVLEPQDDGEAEGLEEGEAEAEGGGRLGASALGLKDVELDEENPTDDDKAETIADDMVEKGLKDGAAAMEGSDDGGDALGDAPSDDDSDESALKAGDDEGDLEETTDKEAKEVAEGDAEAGDGDSDVDFKQAKKLLKGDSADDTPHDDEVAEGQEEYGVKPKHHKAKHHTKNHKHHNHSEKDKDSTKDDGPVTDKGAELIEALKRSNHHKHHTHHDSSHHDAEFPKAKEHVPDDDHTNHHIPESKLEEHPLVHESEYEHPHHSSKHHKGHGKGEKHGARHHKHREVSDAMLADGDDDDAPPHVPHGHHHKGHHDSHHHVRTKPAHKRHMEHAVEQEGGDTNGLGRVLAKTRNAAKDSDALMRAAALARGGES